MNNTNLTRLKREFELMKKKPSDYFTAYPIQVNKLYEYNFSLFNSKNSYFNISI